MSTTYSTTYTKALVITYTNPSDVEKHWGYNHPLYDNLIIDVQYEGLIPPNLDDYPATEVLGPGQLKEHFTSEELRDRYLAVLQAVSDDLGTPFTYELVDLEPFTFP